MSKFNVPDHPLNVTKMTPEELDAALRAGCEDAVSGRTVPADEAFRELRQELGIASDR